MSAFTELTSALCAKSRSDPKVFYGSVAQVRSAEHTPYILHFTFIFPYSVRTYECVCPHLLVRVVAECWPA